MSRRIRISLAALIALAVAFGVSVRVNRAADEASKASSLSAKDKKFVEDAAMGGMMEVNLGKVAAQNAASAEVKQFGQMMVDDHSKANDELKKLAEGKGVTVPADVDEKMQKKIDKMSKLSGADFDKAYMKDMVKDHEKDVKEFQKEADKGDDAELKAWASKTLPTLQAHLDKAKEISHSVAGEKK